jgi:hypothetical protein
MTSFPKVQHAVLTPCYTLYIQLKNALTGAHSHMIDKARSSISELYSLHQFPNDAERLVAINVLLEHNTFALRDSDRDLTDGVSSS